MATSKIYTTPGAIITFRGAGGGDVLWTPQNEPINRGRCSAPWDRGAGPWPTRYAWRMRTRWQATATAGDEMRIYLMTMDNPADGSTCDGGYYPSDTEWGAESNQYYGSNYIGSVISSGVNQPESASGICEIFARYVALVMWNGAASKALTNTVTDHIFTLQELPDDIETAS